MKKACGKTTYTEMREHEVDMLRKRVRELTIENKELTERVRHFEDYLGERLAMAGGL